jgi:hypothetical protein
MSHCLPDFVIQAGVTQAGITDYQPYFTLRSSDFVLRASDFALCASVFCLFLSTKTQQD